MKKVLSILGYIGLFLVSILSLVFAFVEIRPLFAGDFTIMESHAMSFITYLFRGLFYLSILAFAIILVVKKIKKSPFTLSTFIVSLLMLVGALFTFFFYDYYIAFAVIGITAVLLAIVLVRWLIVRK